MSCTWPRTRYHGHLDVEHHTSRFRPRQPVGHSRALVIVLGTIQIERRAQKSFQVFLADSRGFGRRRVSARRSVITRRRALFDPPSGEFSGDSGYTAIQLPDAGLPGVPSDDGLGRPFSQVHILPKAMAHRLVGPEEPQSDRKLLGVQVSRKTDDLHAVPKRLRDPSERVGSGDEQNIGEVVFQLQVVIRERLVLLRVQDLQEGRTGIAMEVMGQLVDLIEEENRVGGPAAAHPLEHPPRQGTHVGAPVTPDFGLVSDAPQADAEEFPAEGRGDTAAERGLADPGWTNQAEDGSLQLTDERQDRDMVEDAILHLSQPVVGLIERG